MSGKFLDFLVWNHILHLSKGDRNWSFWGPLAEVAMILVSCAVSEADVEGLLSVQKNIQGSTTTNISAEGLTARLRLYGSRPIDSVKLDVLENPTWQISSPWMVSRKSGLGSGEWPERAAIISYPFWHRHARLRLDFFTSFPIKTTKTDIMCRYWHH